MSDDYQYIDVNDEQFEGTPRALREALDKAQKALKAEKQATAELRTHQASTALSDVLTGFRNPEKVKTDLLRDKIDPLDKTAVEKWLGENGEDYAKGTAAPVTPESQEQERLAGEYAGLQLGDEYRPAADLTKLDAVVAKITPDMDGAAVAKLYQEAGI
jgi:hypothetical protein